MGFCLVVGVRRREKDKKVTVSSIKLRGLERDPLDSSIILVGPSLHPMRVRVSNRVIIEINGHRLVF